MSKKENKKRERILLLQETISELRQQYRNDLKSKDPKRKLTALAVALIDKTYARIGNKKSAQELKHYGVTTWLARHVTINGSNVIIKYVGKSGVSQTKEFKSVTIANELQRLKKNSQKGEPILRYPYGDMQCSLSNKDVNQYLEPFGITAKDIRGYHANSEMVRELKTLRKKGKPLPSNKKEKEKILSEEFRKALEIVSKKLGHEETTLRNQYLLESFEATYMKTGKPSLEKTAIRVAKRYAALFEVPPKVLEQLYKIVKSEYAKSVLPEVTHKLHIYEDLKRDNIPVKEQFSLERDPVIRWINFDTFEEELKEQKYFEYYANLYSYRGKNEDHYGPDINAVIRIEYLNEGTYGVSATIYGKVFSIKRETYRKKIRTKSELKRALIDAEESTEQLSQALAGMGIQDEEIQKLSRMRDKLLQDVDYNTTNQGEITQDLTGWKYIQGLPDLSISEVLQKFPVSYKIEEGKPSDTYIGSWNASKRLITIKVFPERAFSERNYTKELDRLYDTCEHEVLHYAQDLLAKLKGHDGKIFGLPSKKQPSTYVSLNEDVQGYLNNPEEYKAWLVNEISRFTRQRESYPRNVWETLAKEWIGVAKEYQYFDEPSDSDFFKALKKQNRALWRKAVKEFLRHTLL